MLWFLQQKSKTFDVKIGGWVVGKVVREVMEISVAVPIFCVALRHKLFSLLHWPLLLFFTKYQGNRVITCAWACSQVCRQFSLWYIGSFFGKNQIQDLGFARWQLNLGKEGLTAAKMWGQTADVDVERRQPQRQDKWAVNEHRPDLKGSLKNITTFSVLIWELDRMSGFVHKGPNDAALLRTKLHQRQH